MMLSILIPCYNEERTVAAVIARIRQLALPVDHEIVVVDDGSTDSSPQILRRLAQEGTIRLRQHARNCGKGAAVQTAVDSAEGDYVLIQDADLEYAPEDYARLLKPVWRGKADAVLGIRNRRANDGYSPHRWFAQLASKLISLRTGQRIYDVCCGPKLLPQKLLADQPLEAKGFELDAEIAYRLTVNPTIRLVQIRVSYTPRRYREGKKIRMKDALAILRLLCRASPSLVPNPATPAKEAPDSI